MLSTIGECSWTRATDSDFEAGAFEQLSLQRIMRKGG